MEFHHLQGRNQTYPVTAAQLFSSGFLYQRVQVDGVHHFHIGKFLNDPANGPEHTVHGLSQVFPAVGGKYQQPGALCPTQKLIGIVLPHGSGKGVNGGISCDHNGFRALSLA